MLLSLLGWPKVLPCTHHHHQDFPEQHYDLPFLTQVLPRDGGEREQAGDKRHSEGGRGGILLSGDHYDQDNEDDEGEDDDVDDMHH